MLTSAFSFSLNNPVQVGGVTLQKIDGENPSLICVTVGGKVFIYTPKKLQGNQDQNVQFLNLNKQIKSIVAGSFKSKDLKQILLLASENTLMAYDIENNVEKFYKEIPDGVSVIEFGEMSGHKDDPLAFVGGNCSLQGFNENGNETYWNVTSDKVSAICLSDMDGDQQKELIVASEDNYIRVFKNEEILFEITEAAVARCLTKLSKSRFAFGLDNGMVGIYQKKSRKWRAKSQVKPISIVEGSFNVKEDVGYRPLVIGRANGQIEIRNDQTGENIHKVMLNEQLSKIIKADFRGDNTQQIIAITTTGSVKGFTLSPNREIVTDTSSVQQKVEIQEEIEQLQKKKQNLLMKFQSLQEGAQKKDNFQDNLILPKDTKISHIFQHNLKKKIVELIIQCSKNVYLKGAILFNDKLFSGEALFHSPKKASNILTIPITLKSHQVEQIKIKVIIGQSPHQQYFQVFEFETSLPKFTNFQTINDANKQYYNPPNGKVNMKINERIPRYMKWLQQSFILEKEVIQEFDSYGDKQEKQTQLEFKLINITNGQCVSLSVNSNTGEVTFICDNIEYVGEMIQDMCQYMNIQELDSQGEFPHEMIEFKKILIQVEQFKSTRMNITADIADSVNNVKTLIVKAEDARIQGDMKFMRKYYTDVMGENKNLTTELTKRNSNNETLMNGLKQINSMINKASNLRIGSHKSRVTNLCRAAIKSNNLHSLIFIIENGREF